MKVLCINSRIIGSSPPGLHSILEEGEVYEVVDETTRYGKLFYELSAQRDHFYAAILFVPVSDIDERDLIRQREDELVNV
jgi:hypothetical protein